MQKTIKEIRSVKELLSATASSKAMLLAASKAKHSAFCSDYRRKKEPKVAVSYCNLA
jgi:hypothetical protein